MRATAILMAFLLAGCIGNDIMDSWRGQPSDLLIASWGPPSEEAPLASGGRVLAYTGSINRFNTYPDCRIIFQADAMGTIVNASRNGTPGGCNLLLLSKPKAAE